MSSFHLTDETIVVIIVGARLVGSCSGPVEGVQDISDPIMDQLTGGTSQMEGFFVAHFIVGLLHVSYCAL